MNPTTFVNLYIQSQMTLQLKILRSLPKKSVIKKD